MPDVLWDKIEAALRERLEPMADSAWQQTWDAIGASGFLSGLEESGVDLDLPSIGSVKNLKYSPARKFFDERGSAFVDDITNTNIDVIKASLDTNWGDAAGFLKSLSGLFSDDRLTRIYRSEVHTAQNGAAIDAADRVGFATKTRTAVGDERTCEICMDYDGETVPINETFSDGSYEGHSHPSCRCVVTFGKVGE